MQFNEQMEAYRSMVEAGLSELVPSIKMMQAPLAEAMRYSLLGGGKRLRAVLLLEFCRISGGNPETVLPFACAIEMIHCYSLIHDDLPCMDNDDLRRGKPTNHRMYGDALALLAGDALLNRAFEVMLDAKNLSPACILSATGEIARCSGLYGMIGGQTIDVQNNGKLPGLSELTNMHNLKTGALILASAKAGCILACAPQILIDAAEDYAKNLGLAFQIQDDILDIEGDPLMMGKSAGTDAQLGKTTFASVLGIAHCKKMVYSLTESAKAALFPFGGSGMLAELADTMAQRKN